MNDDFETEILWWMSILVSAEETPVYPGLTVLMLWLISARAISGVKDLMSSMGLPVEALEDIPIDLSGVLQQ